MADILPVLLNKSKGSGYFNSPDYTDVLEASGLRIVDTETFGSYQGDAIAIVADEEGRLGLVVWGYGSCSGCDHLEAIAPYVYDKDEAEKADWSAVNSYAVEMRESVQWAVDGETVADVAKRALSDDKPRDWYVYDEDMQAYLRAVARGEKPEPVEMEPDCGV